MAEEKKQGFDGLVSLDHYPTREDVEALDSLGLFKGTKLEKAQYAIKAAALASSLMGGPARAGFDPDKITQRPGLRLQGLGGAYYPEDDRIIVDPESTSSATHESIHRGLKLMTDDGKIGAKGEYAERSKDPLEKQVWLAKHDRKLGGKDSNEEILVRGLMKHTAGDPEDTEYAAELKPEAEKIFNTPDGAWWQEPNRGGLPDAAGEIDRREKQMLVERMKEGELPWYMQRPEEPQAPIPQRKPVPAFAVGGLVGSGVPAFAAGGLASPPPSPTPADGGPAAPPPKAPPPPGSLPEEVADDVDAKLSKGEYILPADVVRFVGLEQIEKLVQKAKTGLMAMHEQGRIQAPAGEAPQSAPGGPPAPAPAPLPPAPQNAPSPPPAFAAGGMVGDLYSKTYNDYQKEAGNLAPTIETYTDENGRLAYRYVDSKGKPVAQPKVKASTGFAGTDPAANGTQPNTTPLTNPGTIAPVAPGFESGLKNNQTGMAGHQGGAGGEARDNPGDYSGSAQDFARDMEGGFSMAMGGLPGLAAGAYGFATEGKPMSVNQAMDHAFGLGLPDFGITNFVTDQIDMATGRAQRSTDPKYSGLAPETIMEDGSRIKWSQPVTQLNDTSSNGQSAQGFKDSLGGSYNKDGTYTDANQKTSAVGPASAVKDYDAAKQSLPDAVAARAGLANPSVPTTPTAPTIDPMSFVGRLAAAYGWTSAQNPSGSVGGYSLDTGFGGGGKGMGGDPTGGYSVGSLTDAANQGSYNDKDYGGSYNSGLGNFGGPSSNTSSGGFGGFGFGGGYTSDSPGTAGGGGGADGNNGAGSW